MADKQTTADEKAQPKVGFNDKGERVSVTFKGLQEEKGEKAGAELYYQIARAGGFGDIRSEQWVSGIPDLDLSGLTGEYKAAVDALLASKETK